jgi:hypothetical protein
MAKKLTFKGAKGTLTRDFSFAPISIEGEGKNVRIWAKWPRKKEAALVGTIYSHIQQHDYRRNKRIPIQTQNSLLTLPNLCKAPGQICPD